MQMRLFHEGNVDKGVLLVHHKVYSVHTELEVFSERSRPFEAIMLTELVFLTHVLVAPSHDTNKGVHEESEKRPEY